eukprot:4398624-Prymnesium_polylepis.1
MCIRDSHSGASAWKSRATGERSEARRVCWTEASDGGAAPEVADGGSGCVTDEDCAARSRGSSESRAASEAAAGNGGGVADEDGGCRDIRCGQESWHFFLAAWQRSHETLPPDGRPLRRCCAGGVTSMEVAWAASQTSPTENTRPEDVRWIQGMGWGRCTCFFDRSVRVGHVLTCAGILGDI